MSDQPPSADLLATLAAIQAKTGFAARSKRPGWSFEISPSLLEKHVQPGQEDPWTPEQRAKGVTVDFVHLTLRELERAEGRAGQRFARYGGNAQSSPQIIYQESARLALASVDGKEVPENDDARDAVWQALGKDGRRLCISRYVIETGDADTEENNSAFREAAERAHATFRVRV